LEDLDVQLRKGLLALTGQSREKRTSNNSSKVQVDGMVKYQAHAI
jgi:hypothetical protein